MTAAERLEQLRTFVVGTATAAGDTVRHRMYWQARLFAKLARLAADDRPIVVGPWHGEVGFEILYWAPFVTWMCDAIGIKPDRLHVISRGGVASWYGNVAAHYAETFDHWSASEFRDNNAARKQRTGREKQEQISRDERALIATVGLAGAHLFHPLYLYKVLWPFWVGQASYAWARRFLHFKSFAPPPLPDGIPLPDDFIAVKFYFNSSFPDTPHNRRFAADVIARLARRHAVVLLTTGFRVDEHEELGGHGANVSSIAEQLTARDNLEVQTAVLARARASFGTYGGFSYVASFLGVPSYAFYSDPANFNLRHLDVMNAAAIDLGAIYTAAHVEGYAHLADAI